MLRLLTDKGIAKIRQTMYEQGLKGQMKTWCPNCQKYTESNKDIETNKLIISTYYFCVECRYFKELTQEKAEK